MPSLPFDLIGSRHPGDTGSLASTAVPARLRNHYLYQCGNDTANRFTFSRLVPGYPFLLCRSSVRGLGPKPVPGIGPQWDTGVHRPRPWGRRLYLCSRLPNSSATSIRISAFGLQEAAGPSSPLQRFLSVERPFKSVRPCPSFLPESNTAAPVQRHGENDAIHGFAGFTGIGC